MKRHLDNASTVILVITLVLFVVALFLKGFTHDLLLEAGVFLVSAKLIIAGYKHEYATNTLVNQLNAINSKLDKITNNQPSE